MMSTGSRNNGVIGAAARLAGQLGSVRLLQHWEVMACPPKLRSSDGWWAL